MPTVFFSELAMTARPVLMSWLRGLGRDVRPFDASLAGPDDNFVVMAGEPLPLAPRTLVIETGDIRIARPAADGRPARLGYGNDDLLFGHAFAAELLRASDAPSAADPQSLALFALAERVAQSDVTVLVGGPTGTGKEVLSRFIHNRSPRSNKSFVAVNCAALPETMLEALLFGHQKGAFTGAAGASQGFFRAADGGTLFLDEIGELPLALQAKLLRALQEREVVPLGATEAEKVDVRVIAAANRDLREEVEAGRFRADLYYRLSVFPLSTTPLAGRRQDIAALIATLLLRHVDIDRAVPWPTLGALDRLQAHDWPGNVRELENVLQRALLLATGDRIEVAHLIFDNPAAGAVLAPLSSATLPFPLKVVEPVGEPQTLGNIVRLSSFQAVLETLAACNGNRIETARRLGISERTLRYRLAAIRAAEDENLREAVA